MLNFFVCPFVYHTCDITLVNDGICACDFALKALEYRNNFDIVGLGKVCSCAPTFNFLHTPPTGNSPNRQSPENGKIWDFLPLKCDRMNQSRQNLAHKHSHC